jgi:hypothetical protein
MIPLLLHSSRNARSPKTLVRANGTSREIDCEAIGGGRVSYSPGLGGWERRFFELSVDTIIPCVTAHEHARPILFVEPDIEIGYFEIASAQVMV